MYRKTIIWTKSSLIEFENILVFYIQRNNSSTYSEWLFVEIGKRIELISNHPNIGRVTDLPNFKIFTFIHYGIIYKNVGGLYLFSQFGI